MLKIIPAILSHNVQDFMNKLHAAEPYFTEAQVDFMDGEFVPNKSIVLADLQGLETPLKLEAHLMVKSPLAWVEGLAGLGFGKILIHVEIEEDLEGIITKVEEGGMEVGLVINPETDDYKLDLWLGRVRTIQVMGVNPGHYGATFHPEVVGKVKRLREKGFSGLIQVDGGVAPETAPVLKESGIDKLVVGHDFFGSEDHPETDKIEEKLKELREAIGKAQ